MHDHTRFLQIFKCTHNFFQIHVDVNVTQLVLSLVHLLQVNSHLKVLAVGEVGPNLAILLVMAALKSPYLEILKLYDYNQLKELHFPLSEKVLSLGQSW